MKNNRKKHACPVCGKLTTFFGNPFRPFCCKRCKEIDLGKWLCEEYRISKPIDEGFKEEKGEELIN